MASDGGDDVERTDAIAVDDLDASDQPTEEAARPAKAIPDDGPTRPFPQPDELRDPEGLADPDSVGVHLQTIRRTVPKGLELLTEDAIVLPTPTGNAEAGGLLDADTVLTPDTPWKGLHPVSLAVNLFPRAWATIRSMWPFLLFVVVGGEGVGMRFVDLMVVLVFTLASVWNTFIHWATLRYRMQQGRLEINSGLLNRRSRTIDPARIQNVELVQNLFHSWTGLVELRIDTAGEQSTEGLLSALSVEDATLLRDQLAEVGSLTTPTGDEETDEPIVSMGIAEILAFGLTQRTIGTVAVITAVGLELMNQAGPEVARELTVKMQPSMIIAAFMLAFVGSWAVSALTSVFRFFGYKMTRLDNAVRTTQGLTTKRNVEIPLSKVQMVRTDEPLIRRLMGYGTVLIETAGLGVVEGQVRQAEGMVPMVESEELSAVASCAVPHAQVDPWSTPLRPAHPRSLYRALVGASVRALVIIGFGFAFLESLRWVMLVILPLALVGAWLDWAKQGWLVTPTSIVSRRGFFNRRTFILSRDKLQSVHIVQGPFMRLHGLSRMVVRVAGSQVSLPETGAEDTAWLEAEMAR